MVAALQQQLIAAIADGFLYLDFISLYIGDIGLCMPGLAVKVAELTVGHTHVGRVYIAVYLPGDDIIGFVQHPQLVTDGHQFGGWSMFEEKNGFFNGQKFQVKRFLV